MVEHETSQREMGQKNMEYWISTGLYSRKRVCHILKNLGKPLLRVTAVICNIVKYSHEIRRSDFFLSVLKPYVTVLAR